MTTQLSKLIKIAKYNFDLAFLLAENNNLHKELFDSLRKNYDISILDLKDLMCIKKTNGFDYLNILYNVESIDAKYNRKRYLDFSNNLKLKILYSIDGWLEDINLENNTLLEDLSIQRNLIKSIDITKNINLNTLYIHTNRLTGIDVSKNTKLETLVIHSNRLTSIDLTNNIELCSLHIDKNNISILDLSKNIKIRQLTCDSEIIILNNVCKNKVNINKKVDAEIRWVD